MSRITVTTGDIEVDKPQGGGGRGQPTLYTIAVAIDGKHALSLRCHNFSAPGQMAEFVAILKNRSKNPAASDPLPAGMTRRACVDILRSARRAAVQAEADRQAAATRAAGREKESPATVCPIDVLLDYIDTAGFPAPEK
jgi:hypothetical protein